MLLRGQSVTFVSCHKCSAPSRNKYVIFGKPIHSVMRQLEYTLSGSDVVIETRISARDSSRQFLKSLGSSRSRKRKSRLYHCSLHGHSICLIQFSTGRRTSPPENCSSSITSAVHWSENVYGGLMTRQNTDVFPVHPRETAKNRK
jgi:hypothetical protein